MIVRLLMHICVTRPQWVIYEAWEQTSLTAIQHVWYQTKPQRSTFSFEVFSDCVDNSRSCGTTSVSHSIRCKATARGYRSTTAFLEAYWHHKAERWVKILHMIDQLTWRMVSGIGEWWCVFRLSLCVMYILLLCHMACRHRLNQHGTGHG